MFKAFLTSIGFLRMETPGAESRGASLLEYMLLAALLVVAVVFSVQYLGTTTSQIYSTAGSALR
jgi:Flp pilus assembly pilin Flp